VYGFYRGPLDSYIDSWTTSTEKYKLIRNYTKRCRWNKNLRLTRRVPLVEKELLTLPNHMSSSPVFSGVRVTRSLVLCVCFVDRCLSFRPFSLGHCVVSPLSIYGFWLPLLVSSNYSYTSQNVWQLIFLLDTTTSIENHALDVDLP
jgi:hypothetical protein